MQHPYEARWNLYRLRFKRFERVVDRNWALFVRRRVLLYFTLDTRVAHKQQRYSGTQVGALEIKCKNLQEKSSREARSNEALSKRQKLIASALAALEGEKNSWAIKLKSAALEFGVKSAEERTKYQNQIQKLESEVETLNRDLRRSEIQRREDSNRSMEKLRDMENEIERTELATWKREQKRLALSNAFGRLRSSAENWRVRGLEESLRASLQAQAEMKEIHDEELEHSRDSTSDHLRSIQNRVDSLRRTGEAEMNMLRREFETSMRREVETVRYIRVLVTFECTKKIKFFFP